MQPSYLKHKSMVLICLYFQKKCYGVKLYYQFIMFTISCHSLRDSTQILAETALCLGLAHRHCEEGLIKQNP